jgi:acylphosphatase
LWFDLWFGFEGCSPDREGKVPEGEYRRHVLDVAQELGIAGYARNGKDGSVIIFAQAEEEMLESFLKTVQNPPPPAQVRSIEMREVKPNPRVKTFEIKYGKLADELQEGFGATQTIFMNYWAEFKDY